jgi:hypothetical protein
MSEGNMTVEMSGEKTFGPCACCGEMTRRVWKFVYDDGQADAAYFVEWTPGHDARSAAFDLIVGKWGDDTDRSSREAVSLDFRKLDTGPAFMVIDAHTRTVASSSLICRALSRDEVIGSEIATRAYKICDAIYLEDPRLEWLRA